MKNRAVKLVEIGKVDIFEENIPPLKKGQALVKIEACGVCGSDLHYFTHGGLGSFKETLPFSLGHEPAGEIIDLNGIENFKCGDRVAIEPGSYCGECASCLDGKHNLCSGGSFLGAQGYPGAMADYVVVNENQLEKINDNISFEQATLLEPLGVGMHALNKVDFRIAETVAIFGCGPIGLGILNLVLIGGASRVIMIDKLKYRIEIAKSLGATDVFLDDDKTVERINDITNGGVNIVFDAAGKKETFDKSIKIAGKSGRIALVGIPTYDHLDYNPHKSRIKELSIINCRRSNQTIHSCNKLLAHPLYNTDKILTHKFTIEDAQDAFEMCANYSSNVLKATLKG